MDLDTDARFALRLAVEEVCTNLVEHGYRGGPAGPVEICAQRGADRVTLRIRDRGRPFDPHDAPAPDLSSDAGTRRAGGLGLYLVRQLMDEVGYVADADAGNVLTLVKRTATKGLGNGNDDGNGDRDPRRG
jgi:serine/threonine-protein kinase RsbW